MSLANDLGVAGRLCDGSTLHIFYNVIKANLALAVSHDPPSLPSCWSRLEPLDHGHRDLGTMVLCESPQ